MGRLKKFLGNRKSSLFFWFVFALNFFPVITAKAQPLVPCEGLSCRFCDLAVLIQNIINFGFRVSLVAGVIFIVWGGFLLMTAGGSPERANSGRRAIIAAITGVAIALGSWLIIDTFIKIIGGGGSFGPWNQIPCS